MNFLLVVALIFIAGSVRAFQGKDEKCCVTCTNPGEEKYYSIDERRNNCGECCMKPEDYDLYKKFEKGLEKAQSSTPCADFNYHTYLETETHGFGNITMILDMYAADKN